MLNFAPLIMAGIYIHIPFCRKACHYCNFHFSTSLHRKPALLQALAVEIRSRRFPAALPENTQFHTLYFGGGTPSLLTAEELQYLINLVHSHYALDSAAEITLEANPDDIYPEKLQEWTAAGINRLSLGIQSFHPRDLQWMNRAHNAEQALQAVFLAKEAGIAAISIDLIYGSPGLTDADWLQNLEKAGQLPINHLSCYALTVEEKTALHHFIEKGKIPPVQEAPQARQFDMLMDWAAGAGWDHYEISNLCRPGHPSRHNTAYWTGEPYLGFGPSAHSFNGTDTRWWGIANNALYTQLWLEKNTPAYEAEILSPLQRINEKLMTGLRRREGIPFNAEKGMLDGMLIPESRQKTFWETLKKQQDRGLIVLDNNKMRLSRRGKHFADAVAADLIFI